MQTPQVKCSVLQDCLHFRCHLSMGPWGYPHFWLVCDRSGFPLPHCQVWLFPRRTHRIQENAILKGYHSGIDKWKRCLDKVRGGGRVVKNFHAVCRLAAFLVHQRAHQPRSSYCLGVFMKVSLGGFPGGAIGKEPTCRCRRCKRCGFDPWVEKIPWRRRWQPTQVFLHGESHGQRSLAGYSPLGHKESDTTEGTWHTPMAVSLLLSNWSIKWLAIGNLTQSLAPFRSQEVEGLRINVLNH